jgi:hypothetical protein
MKLLPKSSISQTQSQIGSLGLFRIVFERLKSTFNSQKNQFEEKSSHFLKKKKKKKKGF